MNIKKLNEEIERVLNESVNYTFADALADNKVNKSKESGGLDIDCSYNDLTSLEGADSSIEYIHFNCSHNNLTDLQGCPQDIWELNCSYNNLTSLEGCPQNLSRLKCNNNKLTSLSGTPKYVNGISSGISYDCSNNLLTSLEDLGHVKGLVNASNNKITMIEESWNPKNYLILDKNPLDLEKCKLPVGLNIVLTLTSKSDYIWTGQAGYPGGDYKYAGQTLNHHTIAHLGDNIYASSLCDPQFKANSFPEALKIAATYAIKKRIKLSNFVLPGFKDIYQQALSDFNSPTSLTKSQTDKKDLLGNPIIIGEKAYIVSNKMFEEVIILSQTKKQVVVSNNVLRNPDDIIMSSSLDDNQDINEGDIVIYPHGARYIYQDKVIKVLPKTYKLENGRTIPHESVLKIK